MSKKKPDTLAAIHRLADKIENGHLLADFHPADFLDAVGAELDNLRLLVQQLRHRDDY